MVSSSLYMCMSLSRNNKTDLSMNYLKPFCKVGVEIRGTNGHVNYKISLFFLRYFLVITLKNACLKAQYLFLWSELQTKAPFFGASSGVKSLHFCCNISLLAQMIFPSVRTPSIIFFLESCAKFSYVFNESINNFYSISCCIEKIFAKLINKVSQL